LVALESPAFAHDVHRQNLATACAVLGVVNGARMGPDNSHLPDDNDDRFFHGVSLLDANSRSGPFLDERLSLTGREDIK
jgi:hypothetical protein